MTFFKKFAANKGCPIKLPVISKANLTVIAIEDMMTEGTPIYAWYTLDKPTLSAFESFTGRNLNGLMMFRQESDFLCTYMAHFVDGVMVMRLYEVSMMSAETVADLIATRLTDASAVMYDDSGLTEYQQTFSHNITDEMVREALKNRKSWIIGDEHFYKV